MPTFRYEGISGDGRKVTGTVDARRPASALTQLAERQVSVFELSEQPARDSKLKRSKPKSADYLQLIQQLSVLLRAGIPLLEAVESQKRAVEHVIIRDRLDDLGRLLRQGGSLSEGFRDLFPEFPPLVPTLTALGERTGRLPDVLHQLSEQLGFQEELKSELRGAMTYPAFLLLVGIAAVMFMFLFVVPKFEGMLGDKLDELTGISAAVFGMSAILREQGPLILVGAIGLGVAAYLLTRSTRQQGRLQQFFHRLPIVGPLLQQREIADWTRTVGLSLQSKANLLESVRLARHTIHSPKNRAAFDDLARELRSGTTLDEALRDVPDLEPVVVNLATVGQQAGCLDDMLILATTILDKRVRDGAERLGKLAEPVAVLFISALVGLVVISMVTAMTSLYDIGLV